MQQNGKVLKFHSSKNTCLGIEYRHFQIGKRYLEYTCIGSPPYFSIHRLNQPQMETNIYFFFLNFRKVQKEHIICKNPISCTSKIYAPQYI